MSTFGRASLLLAAASCLLLPACLDIGDISHACTLIGGQDGLIVDVEVTGGTLPPDRYTIIARVGDAETRLEQMLVSEGAVDGIDGSEAVVDGKRLFLDGALFGRQGMFMVGFREGGGPDKVTIEVWRGAVMLAQQTYSPTYKEFRPNGDGCAPELQQARDSLAIVAPLP